MILLAIALSIGLFFLAVYCLARWVDEADEEAAAWEAERTHLYDQDNPENWWPEDFLR